MFLAGIDGALYCRLEVLVESLKHLLPLLGTLGNLIEVLLYLSGEVIVHDFLEILHQEVINHDADICWQELALVRADKFLAGLLSNLLAFEHINGILSLLTFLVTLLNVFTLLDG